MAARTPIDADVTEASADHVLATYKNLSIVIWRLNTQPNACRALHRQTNRLADKFPDGVGLLTVVERSAPMPSTESRKLIASFFAGSTRIKASAVAMEGSGFRASAVRSVVAGLTMMAKQPFPHKVFATLAVGLHWLVPELNANARCDLAESDVQRMMKQLRQHVDANSPARAH
ncbi:MAG: hypothetical protein B7733_09875 [Myxococcales bacterium FL481]|nr:MAG: hypothetical protein B7733_09875 [Myxococcales bacterium FL481]